MKAIQNWITGCAVSMLLAATMSASAAQAAEASGASAQKFAPAAASEKAQAARAFMEALPTNTEEVAPEKMLGKLQPSEAAPSEFDPQANPRVHEIASQLRCLVCANETIAESNAQLAIDLRREVAAQVRDGKTNDEVIAFMVERYGDFVLFKPPFKAKTWLLWLGPIAFLLLVVWGMRRVIVTRRAESKAARESVTPEALERAKAYLRNDISFEDFMRTQTEAAK